MTRKHLALSYISCDRVSIKTVADKAGNSGDVLATARQYPCRLTPYYAGLIQDVGDPIWRQCVPDINELGEDGQVPDPLFEAALSPVPGLIHRYPDRAVLLVSNRCPVYCRFCMRKRHVGDASAAPSGRGIEAAFDYIARTPAIRDVILSGGDPMMLDDESLADILARLREISHVSIIRIGTRIPVTFPQRITPELCTVLKRFHPLYINTHFNHPLEITSESARACDLLADAGVQLGNQSVLLQGVNDSVETMQQLMTGLLGIRVRPYYLHQMDLVRGTAHFRTPVASGIEIMRGLRGHCSGLAVPQYVIDLPGGKGKVPILPDQVERQGNMLIFTTYLGERVAYTDPVTPPE